MVPEVVGPNIMLDQDGSHQIGKLKEKKKENKKVVEKEERFPAIYHVITKRD